MDRSHAAMDRLLRMQQAGAFGFGVFLLLLGIAALLWGNTTLVFACLTASVAFSTVVGVTAFTRSALTMLAARIAALEQRLTEHPAGT